MLFKEGRVDCSIEVVGPVKREFRNIKKEKPGPETTSLGLDLLINFTIDEGL